MLLYICEGFWIYKKEYVIKTYGKEYKMKKIFYLKNVQFTIKDDVAEIQVGDNWGNTIETNIETARTIYRAVRDGKISTAEHGLGTFEAVNQIKEIVRNCNK